MQAALEDIIEKDEDKVLIIDLGPTDPFPVKNIQTLGRQVDLVRRASVIS